MRSALAGLIGCTLLLAAQTVLADLKPGQPTVLITGANRGLGFNPLYAAGLCLIANTAPVAFGAMGIPIIVGGQVTGIDPFKIGQMAGRHLIRTEGAQRCAPRQRQDIVITRPEMLHRDNRMPVFKNITLKWTRIL